MKIQILEVAGNNKKAKEIGSELELFNICEGLNKGSKKAVTIFNNESYNVVFSESNNTAHLTRFPDARKQLSIKKYLKVY